MLSLKDIQMDDITHASFGRRIWYHEESDSDDDDDSNGDNKSYRDIQSDPCVKEKFSFYSTFHGYSIRTHYGGEKIKSGLRVMRPRSWEPPTEYTYEEDEREIGTILQVTKEGLVKVQWDSSDDIQDFKKGPTGQYDLLLFDNAQTGVMHTHVQCDGCSEYPLRGFRWKCLNCVNYDLCTKCYMNDMHIGSHRFKRVQSENAKGVQMSSRQNLEDFTMAHGIGEDAIVQLRSDVQSEGTVEKLLDKKIEAFRSDAKVIKNGSEIRYPVGRDGKCDLKYTKAGAGQLYYHDHLLIVSSDNASTGIRVVRGPEWEENNEDDGGHGYVGTIVKIEKNASEQDQGTQIGQKAKAHVVQVQWDNGNIRSYDLQRHLLRIYDNGPLGVEHETYYCDICNPPGQWNACIKGIRWNCTECQDYDLCNTCYMNDEDDISHMFQRVMAPDKRDSSEDSKFCRENAVKIQSFGIFKGAVVAERFARNTEEAGTVAEICDCNMDNGRSEVAVKWDKWKGSQCEKRSKHDFLELKYKRDFWCAVYPDHLPILGKDIRGYFEVDFVYCEKRDMKKKIKVTIWRNIKEERKVTFKPCLFIIFADHPEVEDKTERLVDEVIEFAKKTKLPCHVAGKKIMFYGGSSNSVFIHHKTDKDVIQELVKRGFRQFERGDIEPKEDEIHYFKRMAELNHGDIVLPVIISLRKGGLRKVMMKSATDLKIPIIRLKKHKYDVTVLIPVKYKNWRTQVKMTEYTTDVKNPWSVQTSISKVFDLGRYDNEDDDQCEIAFISEGPAECRELDALICCLIIGVSMENNSSKKKIYGKYTDMYPNALSVYLLKEGKWKIPKEHIKKSFDQRSIEYIYEQDMAAEFEKGLWSDLQNDTNMAYKPPRLKDHDANEEHTGFNFGSDSDDDSDSSDDDDDDDDYDEDDDEANGDVNDDEADADHDEFSPPTVSRMDKADEQMNEKETRLKVSISELYGLIFFALLQKQYWNGAKQLIETGCIRIHHILVGCVILENVASNWRTAPLLQDRLRRLNKAFTQRAIRILSCIYEADTKSESDIAKQKRCKASVRDSDEENEEELELGEHINHAGRLLLNHGYIEDAIKTQNKTFLDNHYVKNIINKMWYGTEKIKSLTIVGFIVLAVFHIILLPLLMINMEARPLRWLYKQYTLPFMKVCINLLGFLTLLLAYAYMLLFDYSEDGLSKTDLFIITWMASFFLDENKQHIVSIIRKKWKSYVSDWWNRLDWFSIMVYTIGMVLKFGEKSQFRDASKVLLVVAFMLLCIRILNWFCMSESLGPKLVMIRKMFADTFAFMTIMTVIMMCYNISFHALLYSNTEFSWSEMEKITQNGYWMLFGELNLDDEKLTIPDCTFNRTYNESSALMQCPNQIGLYIVPYLKALYGLIAVILLLNLLIAMYSDTFQQVHQESEFHWSQLQNDFLEEYSIKTVFPIHLQLLVLPFTIVHAIFWFWCPYLCGKLKRKYYRYDNVRYSWNYEYGYDEDGATLNRSPMFVRVFLYNTNFDLKLKSTKKVEGNGALKAKGDIDLMETDRVTKLQTQVESNYNKLEQLNDKNEKRNQRLLNRQKEIDKTLRDMQKSIMQRLKDMNHSLKRIEKSSSETVKIMKDGEETSDEEEIDHIIYSTSSDDDDSDRLSISSDFEETNDPECKMQ